MTLSNVSYLMHTKMCIYYSLIKRLASYKAFLCYVVLSVIFCTIGYVCSFRGGQIVVDFVSFLSMIICDRIWENVHSSHIQVFSFEDS